LIRFNDIFESEIFTKICLHKSYIKKTQINNNQLITIN